ncbi:MAG TPA: putative toxin-antitoxin system toxin component, PIN family [Vicinamibacterales bacterium]|nr:putative toxin-antitoxin system toxin component, PIN family [Vicinamibacterales bacterium]
MTAAVGKVVFDTNILISGHFWKGPPYRCLLAAEARLAVLVVSDAIVSELREKLTDKFAVPAAAVDAIIDRLSSHAERVHVQGRSGWVPQDADDDKFIDAALSSGATLIVSGDRHLLALGTVEGIEVITARQFLDRLAAVSPEGSRDPE